MSRRTDYGRSAGIYGDITECCGDYENGRNANDYFKDMELSDAQKDMVMDYLNNVENQAEEETTDGGQTESESEMPVESKVYQMYLEDLAGIPEYNEEERITFYKALLAGDEKAIEPISMFSLRNVLKIADKYIEPKLLVEDLMRMQTVL